MGLLRTIRGLVEEDTLSKTVGIEIRPTKMVLWIEWRAEDLFDAEVIKRDAFPLPRVTTDFVETTIGRLPRTALSYMVQYAENANDYAVNVEWKHKGEIVRQDANTILKRIPEEMQAVVGAMS